MIVSPNVVKRVPETPATAAPAVPLRRLAFHALGTQCEVQYAAAANGPAEAFERAAVNWVQQFEAKYSRFRPASLVSRINTAAGHEWLSSAPEQVTAWFQAH